MSEGLTVAGGDRSDLPALLSGAPLLAGVAQEDVDELARVVRPRTVAAGHVLWRQGEEATALALIAAGRVSVTVTLPGQREIEVAGLGPGDVLGEIALLDGGRHPVTARAAEPATLLLLSRADFVALVSRRDRSGFALKRNLASVACARLRVQLGDLAASLSGDAGGEPLAATGPAAPELEPSRPPDSRYVRRLATFHDFDSLALWGFLTAGRFARCRAGTTLVAEGTPSEACFLTINGAVEKVIVRGGRRIRVGLAGPGMAFGYETLVDGGPSPVTATARERTLLLVLPQEAFARLFHGEESGSHVFLDVIHRDLMAALRQALRPHARLTVSV